MLHVCTSIKGEFGIGNKCILLDEYVEVVCCQNGVLSECQSPAGYMPAIWYFWFWVDSDGIRPLCQSSFGHLLVNLGSYVFVVFYVLGCTRRYYNQY